MVDVGGDCCTLQKFVKSQLRTKRYELKLTEVYPVSPDLISIPGKIRGLDESDSTGEDDASENVSNHRPSVSELAETTYQTSYSENSVDTSVQEPSNEMNTSSEHTNLMDESLLTNRIDSTMYVNGY